MKKTALLILLGVGSFAHMFSAASVTINPGTVENFRNVFSCMRKGDEISQRERNQGTGLLASFLARSMEKGYDFESAECKYTIKQTTLEYELSDEVILYMRDNLNLPKLRPGRGFLTKPFIEAVIVKTIEAFPGCLEVSPSKIHCLLDQAEEERRTYRKRLRKRTGSKRAAEQGISECNKRIKTLKEDIQAKKLITVTAF